MSLLRAPHTRTILQNAWVVDDLEAGIARWTKDFGVGPFFIFEHGPNFVDVTYRGQPATLSMRTAIAQASGVQVELVQPTVSGPSCYRDTVSAGTTGFHHICVWSQDIDADIAFYKALGFQAANTGRMKESVRFAYIDTTAALDCMVELLEYDRRVEKAFTKIAEAAQAWDGVTAIGTF